MKVLLINNFHYRKGGSETVYFNTADILKKAGHKVIFFSTKDKENNLPCEQEEFFVTRNDDKSLLKAAASYIYNTEVAKSLEKLIQQEHPDVAHVHLFWGGISPSIFKILKRHNIPLIHTVHDYRMVCPAYAFNCNGKVCEECHGEYFYKCAVKRCSKGSLVQSALMSVEMYIRQWFFNPLKNIAGFIFVSEFSHIKHIQNNAKFASANSMVLYNYTSDDAPLFPKQHEDYFLFFGRLSYEKGLKTLINAVREVPGLRLKVVGSGPLERVLKTTSNHSGRKNIEFVGYKTGEALREYVRRAKFVVVPSECFENNPMTIVESYSMATPVIGARIGGIPEIVIEGKTGFTFTSGCEEELTEVINRAINLDEEAYQLYCKEAYTFYQNNFSENNYSEKLITFYKSLIK